MATYSNAGDNANIDTDLGGSISLGASDIVNVMTGDVDYDDTLDALGSTVFAEFNTGPDYAGNLGQSPLGLQVPADQIVLNDRGRMHAVRSVAGHTMDLLAWKNLVGGSLVLHDIVTLTDLNIEHPGTITVKSSGIVTNATLSNGSTTFESAGTAITALKITGVSGKAVGITSRSVTTMTINKNAEGVTRDAAAVTNLNNNGGLFRHESSGAITNISAQAGSVFDFRKAKGNSASITWDIDGPITIYEPPYGITIDMPTSGEAGQHTVTSIPAA